MAIADMTRYDQQFGTFAPSKGDIVGAIEKFMGKPSDPKKLEDYTENHAMTYHYPDAFLGQNTTLRDQLNNLILNSPEEWQTNIGLPFTQISGVEVQWDEIKFDVRLLERVPYEGASRMQTSIKRHHRDRVVRRGTAIIIESDFYRTAEGRKYFADQITSVRFCVQVTCNYDVLFSYLTCDAFDFKYDLKKSLLPRRNLRAAMRYEIETYAAVQKEGRGFDRIVEIAKSRMARYNVRPNMIILAPETELYVTIVPNERITFYEGGDRAVSDFKEGPDGFKAKAFRGLGVVTTIPFDSGENVEALQMLERPTQVGEYYTMKPPHVWNMQDGLQGGYMDILIFDEPLDKLTVVTFEDAILHGKPWNLFSDSQDVASKLGPVRPENGWLAADANPGPPPIPGNQAVKPGPDFTAPRVDAFGWINNLADGSSWFRQLEESINALSRRAGGQNPGGVNVALLDRLEDILDKGHVDVANAEYVPFPQTGTFAAVDKIGKAGANWTPNEVAQSVRVLLFGWDRWDKPEFWRAIIDLVALGVWIPIRTIIARPFIEHRMLSAIVTVAGRDTGVTLFGPADMQISANTTVKVIEGHYTCHVKSVITKPENVLVLRDIQCVSYVTGGGTRFFGSRNEVAYDEANEAVKDEMRARLDFEHEDTDDYKDMLAFVAPFEQPRVGVAADTAFSLSQMEVPWDAGRPGLASHHCFPGGNDFWKAYDHMFDLNRTLVQGVDPVNVSNREFVRNGSFNNSFVFPGPYRAYTAFTRSFWELNPGQGHFGPDALPGDARWRRGESVSMDDARGSLVGVEMLQEGRIAVNRAHA